MKNGEEIKLAVTGNSWMVCETRSIQSMLEDTFSKAKNEVLIAAYAISGNREFIEMLENLLSHGIRVTIVINRFYNQPQNIHRILKKLCSDYNNLIIFDFKPYSNLEDLHAKLIVVDHSLAIVGSANLSERGFFRNHELVVQISGKSAHTVGTLIERLIKSKNTERVNL